MPSLPSMRDVHPVNQLLTDMAIGYGQELAGTYCVDRATTPVPVKKQSNTYAIWDKGDMFRDEFQLRVSGQPSVGVGQRVSTGTYSCKRYALHATLGRDELANSDFTDLEKKKIRLLAQKAKIKRDRIYAANVFATGLWTSNTEQTGVASGESTNQFRQFNDGANSDPIKVILDQQSVLELSTGLRGNKLVTNRKVLRALRQHPDLLALTQYTSPGLAPMQTLLETFELEEIVIADGIYNTAAEGQTASMARIIGNHMLLCHIAPKSTDEPTAVCSFVWSEFDQVTENDVPVKSWFNEDLDCHKYEGEICPDTKITANDLGVFFKDVVA